MGTFIFLEWGILVVIFELQQDFVVSCLTRTDLTPTE